MKRRRRGSDSAVSQDFLFATPATATAQNVCLQRKDITGWKALDENSIGYMDRQGRTFTVRFGDNCPSGTRNPSLVYGRMKRSGCLAHGDVIDLDVVPIPPKVCVIEQIISGMTSDAPVARAEGGLSQPN
jgi:hypothetical protein